MQAVAMLVMVPLMLLNLLGGVVSGIWLALLGQWWAVGYGLIGLLLSHFHLSIILMPGLLFAAPAGLLLDKERPVLAVPFLLLSQAYTCIVITGWCIFVLALFMNKASAIRFGLFLFGPTVLLSDLGCTWRKKIGKEVREGLP